MAIIQNSPFSNSAVYNPLIWGCLADQLINTTGSEAGFTITFDSGGTTIDGTTVTVAGVEFKVKNSYPANGTFFDFNGLTDIQRATDFYNGLIQNIYFSPDKVNILQLGNSIGVTYNQIGLQPNWTFNNGGISEVSFFDTNGTDTIIRQYSYVHNIFEDRALLSTFPKKLTDEKETPVSFSIQDDGSPSEKDAYIDYSEDLRNFVSTSLPNIYTAALTPYLNPLYAKRVFLRVGLIERDNCNVTSREFENSEVITIYNCGFQKSLNVGDNLLAPYLFNGKPFLIKDTYEICKNQSFYVWVRGGITCGIVYYDSNNTPIESGTFSSGENESSTDIYILNCGTDVLAVPINCAYYVLVFGDAEQFPIRVNVNDCCGVAEFIALCDLGEYEVYTFDFLEVKTDERTSDTVNNKSQGDVQGLISGGASVTNTKVNPLRVYSKTLEYTPQDAEYWAQFKRSSSFAMKVFNKAADAYFWQKIVPTSIEFNEQERDNYIEIKFTFNENQLYLNNEQNDSYPL